MDVHLLSKLFVFTFSTHSSISKTTKLLVPSTSQNAAQSRLHAVYDRRLLSSSCGHANRQQPGLQHRRRRFAMTDGRDALTPSQTTIPTSSNSASSFDMSRTASPGSVGLNQGDQQIEQGPNGVKTVINSDQTIIDGPSGKTVINGGQTIIQTKNSHGGQTMVRTDEGSTGGAAMATGFPLAGAVMAAGGAVMLF